jgi:CheY-like chemotaxis protein
MVHILIVDDRSYLCELFPHELMGENCRITCASNKESVKRCLAGSMPDMVLLEISLHGFEGWEVLHYIKTANPHLPVFIVTSYDNYPNDPRAGEADGYMLKDFIHLELLKEKITRALAAREQSKIPYPMIEAKTILPLNPYHAPSTGV